MAGNPESIGKGKPQIYFQSDKERMESKGLRGLVDMAYKCRAYIYGKSKDKNLYYWTAEGTARAEVDFVIQDDKKYIIPIEVKAGTAKHARSLTQYCKLYSPEKSVLTSLDEMSTRTIPLYAFWKFKDWLMP